MRRVAAIAGATSVGIDTRPPMTGQGWQDPVLIEGQAYAEGQRPPLRRFRFVSPSLFEVLGISLVAGRDLTWEDTYKKFPVGAISENMAREVFGDARNALGKRIRVSTKDDWREIVGVVGRVHDDGVNQKSPTSVYWPLLTQRFEGDEISVRRDVAVCCAHRTRGVREFHESCLLYTSLEVPSAKVAVIRD